MMTFFLIAALIQAFVIVISQDGRIRQFGAVYTVPLGIAIAGLLAAAALLQL